MIRVRVTLRGLVQGVGFRPFVYRRARLAGLSGWVGNTPAGVELEVQGEAAAVEGFLQEILREPPEHAVITACERQDIPLQEETEFVIRTSFTQEAEQTRTEESRSMSASPEEGGQAEGTTETLTLATLSFPPDLALCEACREELFQPTDRRFRHPFLSCTHCGPRFTMITGLPYDRPRTTMAAFPLCPQCEREYTEPADRRFHAQSIACPHCGPVLTYLNAAGEVLAGDPLTLAVAALREGKILAVKGLGGFHLACLATAAAEETVVRLRERKGRGRKPLAVMFPDLAWVRAYCQVSEEEAALLKSPTCPIVLLSRREQKEDGPGFPKLAAQIAPGLRELGAFLPYTPLHALLLEGVGAPLVMTSANRSGEPLVTEEEEAVRVLAGLAEGFLTHNRRIVWPCDDSIARVVRGRTQLLRRSRGYVPAPLVSQRPGPAVLACGAELKNAFALAAGQQIYLGPYQGDLKSAAAYRNFREGVARFQELLGITPQLVVHDLHPQYLSSQFAQAWSEANHRPRLAVQHHHAHAAATLAEHGRREPALAAVFDGEGYGEDGALWGGEFLLVDAEGKMQRLAHLQYLPLPGGERAILEPWRIGAAALSKYVEPAARENLPFARRWLATPDWAALERAVARGLNAPPTSSLGRLFDAVAAVLGGPAQITYEGEAAIWLENQAWRAGNMEEADIEKGDIAGAPGYAFVWRRERWPWVLDPTPLWRALAADLQAQTPVPVMAARFHRGVAAATVALLAALAEETGVRTVVLSGGVWQNLFLLQQTLALCERNAPGGPASGLGEVLWPQLYPPNDGGIALGQVWVAWQREWR